MLSIPYDPRVMGPGFGPDLHIQEKLEGSLAMHVLAMFALVARAGGAASAEKKEFVRSFFSNLFARDVAAFLNGTFESYIKQDLKIDPFALAINKSLSYQAKIFCLLLTYEFIVSTSIEGLELFTVRKLAEKLHVEKYDLAFMEHSFSLQKATAEDINKSNIISLRITDNLDTADVYLPFPGLDLLVYKIQNTYYITVKNDNHTLHVEGNPLINNFLAQMSQQFNLSINDYTIQHHDLIHYFRNKVSKLESLLYIRENDLQLSYDFEEAQDSAASIRISGSHIVVTPLDRDSLITVNRERITEPTYINLNDQAYVNGFRLEPRELFYYLGNRNVIPFRDKQGKKQSQFEITNDIKGHIFIHDDLATKWTATITWENNGFLLFTQNCPYQIHINERPFKPGMVLRNNDIIFLNNYFLRIDTKTGCFRKSRFGFSKLTAKNISYSFDDGTQGIDEVSFDVNSGELVCIMGPSGSGKSTFLNIMSGLYVPDKGKVLVDDMDLHRNYGLLKDFFGYVPQDNLLLPNLTVEENLYYHAKLRFPDRKRHELLTRIDLVLESIRLTDKRDVRVGDPTDKTLSGGERKRLNIGMELLADAEVYYLDEPTSGLSSKDSEKILDILAGLAHRGKIVLAVLHQPSSRLFEMFHKVVLLDQGGRLAYYGSPHSALEYFQKHMAQDLSGEAPEIQCPHCKVVQPDVLLDSLEYPLRDIDGAVLGERKYSPEYWKELYRSTAVTSWFSNIKLPGRGKRLPPIHVMTKGERFGQFLTMTARNFTNKIRDRSNLLITFLEAPLMGAGVGFILKYAPTGDYSLYTNSLFKSFLFIAVIVSIFLSMTNSVDEIISDTALFLRERMLNTTHRGYLLAKLIILFPFSFIQNVLFVTLGFLFLGVRELYVPHILLLSVVSYAGISIGLLISSVPRLSSKAALNIVPLVLIPQIILGGALVEYEKMNIHLTFFKNSPIPEICQFMPSRWAYEGALVMQESMNSYDTKHTELSETLKDYKYNRQDVIDQHGEAFFEAREKELHDELEAFRGAYKHKYGNKSIHDAVIFGEKTREDTIRERKEVFETLWDDWSFGNLQHLYLSNPMFVRKKNIPFTTMVLDTPVYNGMVLVLASIIINFFTLVMLRYRDRLIWGTRKVVYLMAGSKKKQAGPIP